MSVGKKDKAKKYLLRNKVSFIRSFLLALVFLFIYIVLPQDNYFKNKYELNGIWAYENLYAPFDFFVRKSRQEYNEDVKKALQGITPFYYRDTISPKISLQHIRDELQLKKKQLGLVINEQVVVDKIQQMYEKGIMEEVDLFSKPHAYLINFVEDDELAALSNTNFYSLNEVKETVENQVLRHVEYVDIRKSIVQHMRANIVPDTIKNHTLIEDIRSNMSEHKRFIRKGTLIIKSKELIDEAKFDTLNSIKYFFEQSHTESSISIKAGKFLLALFTFIIFLLFIYIYRKSLYYDNRKLFLILLLVFLFIAFFSLIAKHKPLYVNYLPYAIMPIILKILFDSRLALNTYTFTLLFISVYAPHDFEFLFTHIMVGIVAIYATKSIVRRSQFFNISFAILVTYFILFVGFSLYKGVSPLYIRWTDLEAYMFNSLMTLFALPVIYLFEKTFGIASEFTLIEISNTNNSLLKEMMIKAPGTFQHSLQVANLAEAAVDEIGGDSLLVRAGALYHDVGKIKNPHYFIENIGDKDSNPHDKLKYDESAKIIINHIHDGVEIAEEKRLPDIIIDFIRTHHGTTRLDFFYSHFLHHAPKNMKKVSEKSFRYPGPKPYSKETAIIMLADSVEASSRVLKKIDYHTVSRHVDDIVEQKLQQDQLSDSNLTLKDISTIKMVFKSILVDIHHKR